MQLIKDLVCCILVCVLLVKLQIYFLSIVLKRNLTLVNKYFIDFRVMHIFLASENKAVFFIGFSLILLIFYGYLFFRIHRTVQSTCDFKSNLVVPGSASLYKSKINF